MMKLKTRALAVLAALAASSFSCDNGEPPADAYFSTIELWVDDDSARSLLVADLSSATSRIDLAVTNLVDMDIANAVIAARDRGATVRVVGDADSRNDQGFEALEDAGIQVVFGDGDLYYLPEPTLASLVDDCGRVDDVVRCPKPANGEDVPEGAMYRPGDFNLMAHNFAIVDKRTIWNFAGAFDGSDMPVVAFRSRSERMREVFVREFNQLHANVFATTLDVYNGPVKSLGQSNPDFNSASYLTDQGELELRFNPQDRVTKTFIDEIYRARGSVWLMTDNLAEDFVIDALKYKARHFDVRVIVNQSQQSEQTRAAVEDLGSAVRYAPTRFDHIPTIALYDALADRNGDGHPRRVHITAQPMWRGGPFRVLTAEPDDIVEVFPADYFVDGNMWSFMEYRGQVGEIETIDRVENFFESVWNESTSP